MEHRILNYTCQMGKTMGQRPAALEEMMEAADSGDGLFDWTDALFGDVSPEDIDSAAAVERYLKSLRNRKVFLKMTAASIYIPKDNPRRPRGEDAHFISKDQQTIGVADGVGGWTTKGIDGGEYARQLMINSDLALQNEPKGGVNPKRVLHEAYKNTTVQGSSTACIITLSGDRLRAANVGDSGFLVIRNGNVVYKSPIQQRRFNCPYQVGKANDNPSVADEIEVEVEAGDVVVAGTDGLLDNMHASEIEEIVRNQSVREETGLREQACYMANFALYNSFDRFIETPYSIASTNTGRFRRGGKPDDITVIIARIED